MDVSTQVIIHRAEFKQALAEGDLVTIETQGANHHVTLLRGETEAKRERVQSLLEKLKNKQ